MNIEFTGPASIAVDGGVEYRAKIDGADILCHFSYELLEDVDPNEILGNPLEQFQNHQLKLLSIAEKKILDGHMHDGRVQVFTNDLPM